MAIRATIKYHDGKEETHFVMGNSDLSICGNDLAGDDDYDAATETSKPVNCEFCLILVHFCKALKLKAKESDAKVRT